MVLVILDLYIRGIIMFVSMILVANHSLSENILYTTYFVKENILYVAYTYE